MHLVLEDANGNDKIECGHCHWHGNVDGLKRGEYFALTDITEVFCPHCNKYLGFVQHDSSGRGPEPVKN